METVTAHLKLSVLISTYNRRDALVSQTLPAIFNQDLPADEYEVIVIVDGSTDGTGEALRELNPSCALRIIEQPNRGLSAARNTAIGLARSDLVIFIDDDIICSPDVFRRHVEAHAGQEPVVVHGSLFLAPGTRGSILAYANESWYRKYNSELDLQGGLNWPDATFLISNSSMRRSLLLACGGLDEDLPAKDDFELGLRLWKMGVRFQYLRGAVAYELSEKTWKAFLYSDGEAFGRTEVMLCRKHPDYRPRSDLLAGLGRTAGWKRFPRRVVLQLPVSPAHLLTPPIWVCEKLCRFPAAQKKGLRLLEIGRRITEYRAALKEVGSWEKFDREYAVRLPVLFYHHVGPQRPGVVPGLTVSPERFERHVRWLARRGYTGVCPSDWVRWRNEGKGLPIKPVLLTFDDGYADLVEYALPVLRRYGFGAAVYIVTGQLGGTNAWDEARGWGTLRLMSADQIRYWATQGIEFGAHSRTHADLTTLSASELSEEVVGSGKDLESILGSRVVSFVYPYGFHNPAVDDCVRRAFDLAFLATDEVEGLNHLLIDPALMRRTLVHSNDSLLDLELRARWGRNPILDLRARLRLRSRFKHAVHFIFGRAKT
jgi:glycosyltransferase involved in cell wall biosynthesis/peptidoglycan/xylan/chitin deacetylase (PgdA/CDA1 family)